MRWMAVEKLLALKYSQFDISMHFAPVSQLQLLYWSISVCVPHGRREREGVSSAKSKNIAENH